MEGLLILMGDELRKLLKSPLIIGLSTLEKGREGGVTEGGGWRMEGGGGGREGNRGGGAEEGERERNDYSCPNCKYVR